MCVKSYGQGCGDVEGFLGFLCVWVVFVRPKVVQHVCRILQYVACCMQNVAVQHCLDTNCLCVCARVRNMRQMFSNNLISMKEEITKWYKFHREQKKKRWNVLIARNCIKRTARASKLSPEGSCTVSNSSWWTVKGREDSCGQIPLSCLLGFSNVNSTWTIFVMERNFLSRVMVNFKTRNWNVLYIGLGRYRVYIFYIYIIDKECLYRRVERESI